MGEGGMFFGGGFMWIFWILVVVALIVVIKAIAGGGGSGSNSRSPQSDSPMEILKKRYARGEIDEQEFERRRKELE